MNDINYPNQPTLASNLGRVVSTGYTHEGGLYADSAHYYHAPIHLTLMLQLVLRPSFCIDAQCSRPPEYSECMYDAPPTMFTNPVPRCPCATTQ